MKTIEELQAEVDEWIECAEEVEREIIAHSAALSSYQEDIEKNRKLITLLENNATEAQIVAAYDSNTVYLFECV